MVNICLGTNNKNNVVIKPSNPHSTGRLNLTAWLKDLVKFVFFSPAVVDEQYDKVVNFVEKGKKTVKTFHKLLSPRVKQL